MLHSAAMTALQYARPFTAAGRAASYIPELGKADPNALGLCIYTPQGECAAVGDVDARFTVQSICKVISLALALEDFGFDRVHEKVKMEPSGDAFNSIIKLDTASNTPYNPMINSGAIAVVGILAPHFRFEQILHYVRLMCLDEDITLDEAVYASESTTGDRNRAIGYLLKSKGVLDGDAEQCVDLYIRLCSLSVNARSLAGLGVVLANGGIDPRSGVRLLDTRVVRTVKTLMFTCGMYDGSGEFAVRAGIPAKSGVGGGIAACVEGRMGIGCYGPALDTRGNSIGGIKMLEKLSDKLHLHVFDSEQ